MATIGRVIVDVIANTTDFVKGLTRAGGRLEKFRRSVRRFAAQTARNFARAVAAATAALTAMSVQGVRSGDQLAKTAQKLGLAAGELAGLRLAAEETGLATTQLDMGLQRMVRRIAEAAKGTGEAQGALKDLNLSAKELVRLAPEEQFRAVADAFRLVGNQSEKIRLGFKLFDSEGVALVNTLALGRDRLEEFTREAERLGLALDKTQLDNIQEAADAGNRVSKAFSGLGRQLGATFAPAMTRAAEATAGFVSTITQSIPKLAAYASAVMGISRAVDDLTLKETRAELRAVFNELVDAESKMLQNQRGLRSMAAARGFVSPTDMDAARSATEEFARLVVRSQQLQKRLTDLNTTTETTARTFSELPTRSIAPFVASIKAASDELDAFIAKQDALRSFASGVFSRTRTDAENFAMQMRQAREALQAGMIDEETFTRFRSMLIDNMIEPVEDLKKRGTETFDAMREAAIQGARDAQQAFADFLFDPFAEGLNGMVEGFLNAIRRMFANQAATKLFGWISSAFSGFGGNPNDPGGHIGAGLNAQFAGAFSHGGNFKVGGSGGTDSQLVMFRATPGEPVSVGNRAANGGGINLTYNIDARGASSELERSLPAILDRNRQATIEELRRLKGKGRF